MAAGGAACPAGTQRSDWYTGYTGNFACNPCSCGQAVGASCADVRLSVSATSTARPSTVFAQLASGEHVCAAPGTLYRPSIVFTGAPTAPTCAPQAHLQRIAHAHRPADRLLPLTTVGARPG